VLTAILVLASALILVQPTAVVLVAAPFQESGRLAALVIRGLRRLGRLRRLIQAAALEKERRLTAALEFAAGEMAHGGNARDRGDLDSDADVDGE